MSGGGDGQSWDDAPPARGTLSHQPVMLAEVIEHLAPKPGETVIDGTFGGGGYTSAILETGANVIAIDRDPAAIARAHALKGASDRLTVVEGTFGALDAHANAAGADAVDGVVLDVGVSSYQLDDGARGFSFRQDAPLDMRMGSDGPTAADIVNTASANDLAHLFRTYGEERRAGALARAVVADRPFETTRELASLCERVVGKSRDGIHPATRAFQALRIAVNDELGELARALLAAERILKDGGRLVVVAFHSLEDRIVKRFLAARTKADAGSRHAPAVDPAPPSFAALTRKALPPSDAEVAANPRARSAKLRAARRTGAPAQAAEPSALYPVVRLSGVAL